MQVCGYGAETVFTDATSGYSVTTGSFDPASSNLKSLNGAETVPGRPLASSTYSVHALPPGSHSATVIDPSALSGSGIGSIRVSISPGFSGAALVESPPGRNESLVSPSATAIFWLLPERATAVTAAGT